MPSASTETTKGSVFSGESTGDKRTLITEKCIRSVLKAVGKNCVKVIVNDGSTNKKHINVLNKYRKDFHIIDSPQNRGIAATKNEAIKYMYNEQKKGRNPIFVQDILDACNTKETSLHRLFKKKNVMGNLILKKRNTYYYLNI